VNNQGQYNNIFLPEVLTESQCNGPVQDDRASMNIIFILVSFIMKFYRVIIILKRISVNGDTATVQQPIPCRDRAVPAKQVHSYQKYNNDQENI